MEEQLALQRAKDETARIAIQKVEEERLAREKVEVERKAREESQRLAMQKAEQEHLLSQRKQPSFFQIWWNAVTKPNEQNFAEIASSPNARATTAYIWVFVGFLVEFFLSLLVAPARSNSIFQQYGLSSNSISIGTSLIVAFCGAPILAVRNVSMI